MLKNWAVTNFKSIQKTRVIQPGGTETDTLDLKPLTVFCGANSSGKSSLLQSILLIAQTMRHRDGEFPIVLNGDYTSLGAFDDVKTINSETGEIGIGFTFKPELRGSVYKNVYKDEYPFTHVWPEEGKGRLRESFEEWKEKLHKEAENIEDDGDEVDESCRSEIKRDKTDYFRIGTVSFELFFSPSFRNEKTKILPTLTRAVFSVDFYQEKEGAYILKWHISKLEGEEGYDIKTTIELPDGTAVDAGMREEDFFPFEAANRKEFRFQKKLPKQYTLKTGGTNCVFNHFFPEEIKYKISKEYVDFLYILFFLGCYDAKEIAEKFGDKYLMSIKEDLIDNGNFWVLSSEIRKYLDKRRAEPFDFDDMDIIIPPSIYEYIRDHILQKIEGVEGLLESFQYNDPDVFGDLQHADLYGLKEDELLDIDVYPDSYSDPEYPFHYVADPGYRFDGFRWKYELDKLEDQKKELIYKRLYANTNRIAIFARYMFWRWEVNLQSFSNPGSPDDDASEFVKNHLSKIFDAFSKGICYLGPLREDPKPFYPYPGNSDSFDLGRKGEHTAGVLFLHGEKENNLPLPNRKENEEEHTVKTIEAIKQWLSYIGVAEDIKAELNSGIVLKIKTPGSSKWSDLTNVGVGVSQVIPIVVMCLTARKGNTLVFEQPELHLHPKMQTRLAEFFMAIANSGVQCIIETHSEYFINAMRLNIASDDLGKEKMLDNSIIYFVEKIQNSSIFREIKINDLGIIPHWPKDFFDEGIDQTDKIILASSKKRSQKSNDDEESDDE